MPRVRDEGIDSSLGRDGCFEGWGGDERNLPLADLVVFGDGRSASDIACQIASAVPVDPASRSG